MSLYSVQDSNGKRFNGNLGQKLFSKKLCKGATMNLMHVTKLC